MCHIGGNWRTHHSDRLTGDGDFQSSAETLAGGHVAEWVGLVFVNGCWVAVMFRMM